MSANITSVILDIETLSRQPNALITSIGIIAFNRLNFAEEDSIEMPLDLFDQLAAGRHVEPETIQFHKAKGTLPESTGGLAMADAVRRLYSFMASHRPAHVWIQGPDFDVPILANLCRATGMALPWDFWITRDSRTIWDTAFPGVRHESRPHQALADCRATLRDLASALAALNRTETPPERSDTP